MQEMFPNAKPVEETKPVKKVAAKKAAAKAPEEKITPEAATELLAEIAPGLVEKTTAQHAATEIKSTPPVAKCDANSDANCNTSSSSSICDARCIYSATTTSASRK